MASAILPSALPVGMPLLSSVHDVPPLMDLYTPLFAFPPLYADPPAAYRIDEFVGSITRSENESLILCVRFVQSEEVCPPFTAFQTPLVVAAYKIFASDG